MPITKSDLEVVGAKFPNDPPNSETGGLASEAEEVLELVKTAFPDGPQESVEFLLDQFGLDISVDDVRVYTGYRSVETLVGFLTGVIAASRQSDGTYPIELPIDAPSEAV